MVTKLLMSLMFAAAVVALLPAQGASRGGTRMATSTAFECANDLGTGIKTRRKFCDVIIAAAPQGSIVINLPAHAGGATLRFDLHNRFSLPVVTVPVLAFSRHEAVVSVVQPSGDVIGRAAVVGEFRSVDRLFDQIGGGARAGGAKAIAPGQAEAVVFTIPAGIATVGIVGSKLTVLNRGGKESFDTPGRPVAIVSNVRVDYQPPPR